MPSGTWRKVTVAGQLGMPSSGVAAVALEFTVVGPSASGNLHADKDESTPNSTVTYVNYTYAQTQSNTATIAVADDGQIQVEASQSADLIIDVQGYYTAGSTAAGGYVPVNPALLVNTQTGTGLPHAKLAGGSTSTIQFGGNAGIPTTASAVMAEFIITNNTATTLAHYFTPYPADATARPPTSMNFPPNVVADATSAQTGLSTTGTPTGAIKFYLNTGSYTVDLIVYVVGYFTAATSTGAYTPATARIYDSRTSGHTTLAAGATRAVQVTGVAGVPSAGSGIASVNTNLQIIDAGTTANYVAMWADGVTRPNPYSSVNYNGSTVTSNMVTSTLGADGAVQIYNHGSDALDFVIDVEGWYSNVGSAITNGQTQTRSSVVLQADPNGGGPWVTYKYQEGTSGGFANVPVGDVKDAGGHSPSAWPVTTSGGAFTPYTWTIPSTLTAASGSAPDGVVQVEACYGVSSTDTNPVCGAPTNVDLVQSGAGLSPTQDVGPGSFDLGTGDFQLDSTDASISTWLGSLSIGRTLTTLAPVDGGVAPGSQRTDPSGVFGPGWTSDLVAPDAGHPDLKVATAGFFGSLITFAATDGTSSQYALSPIWSASCTLRYVGVGDTAGDGEVVCMPNSTTITMTDSDGTVTTWTKPGSTWNFASVTQPGTIAGAATTNTYIPYTSTGTGSCVSATYAGLPCRVLGAVPSGVSCSTPDTTPGCRSLLLSYGTVTVSGVALSRLTGIAASLPQTSGTSNITNIAAYDYDTNGNLLDEYDPRITPNLKTSYSYTSAGRLATLTPPGQAAWSFGYDSTGRLSTVSRPDPSGSTATTTIVYDIPVTGTGAPIDLSPSQTGTWAETSDLPLVGTAVFPPSHTPAGTTVSTVTSTDWPYATIDYLDINGLQVNTAAYGAGDWQIDTTQYDSNGNDVWDLTAGNRAQALHPTGDTDPYVAGLTSNVDRANLLASTTVYNPLDPSQVTDTYGATHPVTMHDGTVVDARSHEATTYDEGAPNSDVSADGNPYDLPTTVTNGAYVIHDATNTYSANSDAAYPDTQTTHTGYDPIDGSSSTGATSGWTLGQATVTTVQMGSSPSSADLVTKTRYDDNGRTVEQRLPGDSTGTGPRTTDTTYYTATGTGGCVSATQAGEVCSTGPAGQPSTGNPLPVTTYSYDPYGKPTIKTETYGTGSSTVTRTSATTYDGAERPISSAVTVSPVSAGESALPSIAYQFDASTGLPSTTSTGSGASLVQLVTAYDNVGQPTTYTDTTSNTSITGYDIDGNLSSVDDGKGTTSYSYDSSTEHRGLVTGEDIGVTGAPSVFSATYDAAGNLATETYPNGLLATRHYDNAGNLTGLTYAKSGSTWMTFTQAFNPLGQIATQSSPQSSQTFGYDPADRLTTVQDTVSGSCTTRSYAFDSHSNRTSLKSYPAVTGGACSTGTTATTTNTSYDDADRDTNTGYTYDSLGRTLTVPSVDAQGTGAHASASGTLTIGYYSNDMVAGQSQGSASMSFTLDPDQNRINTSTDGATTTTNHYSGDSDSPAWTSTGATAWIRNLVGIDGGLAATTDNSGVVTLQLASPHGDIVATAADTTGAASVSSYSEATEYGAPRSPSSAYSYGWLGSGQRSSNSLAGMILMGVRLYDASTGRFLQVDSVAGGNENSFVYPADPINRVDADGRAGWDHHYNNGAVNVYYKRLRSCSPDGAQMYEVWFHMNGHPGGKMDSRNGVNGGIDVASMHVSYNQRVIAEAGWSRAFGNTGGSWTSPTVIERTGEKLHFSFRLISYGDGRTLYHKKVSFVPKS